MLFKIMVTGILSSLAAVVAPVVGFLTAGTIGLDIAVGADVALVLITIALYVNHNGRVSTIY